MGFVVHLEKGVDFLFMERKMYSGQESSRSKQFSEAGLESDVASIEGGDLILVLRALRRLSGELRKINVSLTNQIYSLRETVHDYSQRVSEDFRTMEKRLRQGLLMELERIERELSRIRCRLEPFDIGQNSVSKSIKLITRRSKSEPSSPCRTETINLKTSSPPSPQIKTPIPSTSTAVILQAYSLSAKRNSDKLPGAADLKKRSRSEERCKKKESKEDKMGRSRSMEASVGDDLLHKSPSYSHNQSASSRERLSSRNSSFDDVVKEDKPSSNNDPPLYLLPYETVEELAVAIDHIVSSGLGIRLIVSAPPVRLKSKEDLGSSNDNLKVAALSHRADFYHRYFEAHYGGNRQRNRVVREDHPRARQEQEKEIEEALAIRNLQEQISRDQEEADASVARRLAEELEKEEEEQRRMNQFRDERVAKRMQNLLISDTSAPQSWQREQAELSSHKRTYSGDGGSQMVPQASSSRDVTFTGRKSRNTQDHPGYFGASSLACHSSSTPPYPQKYGHPVANRYKLSDAVFSANSEPVEEEEFRHVQEEQDAELARLLQEVEQHKTSNRKGPSTSTIDHVEQLDRDRMLAIEVQDRELARILQEKEKARLRRAKERTKLKASLKKEGEITGQNSGERQRLRRGISPEESEFQQEEESRSEFSGRPPRRQDLNAIEIVSQNNPSDGNIATAIDPTYRNVMPTKDREFPKSRPLVVSTPGTSYSDRLRDEESEAPPYMPIAGQRRSLSLEKKKKGRDSCKQQ